MSKENVVSFLEQAATNPELKSQVQGAAAIDELVDLGRVQGYPFSPQNLQEAIPVLQQRQGFFGDLVEAILELFSPSHDDYPATGVQPFSGDLPGRR